MKKKLLTTIILIMFCTLASCQCVKAETEIKTTIQINGATSWTNISASDAYDKCQELNDDNSALGTTGDNVMAHLSTNADWFAVSLLTYSAYGSKGSGNTTSNASGIIRFGHGFYCYTSGIVEECVGTSATYCQSIIDNKETKFVEKLKNKENKENNKPGLGFLDSERITSGIQRYECWMNNPLSIRGGLFDWDVGRSSGAPTTGITFRPVIWVK